MAAVFSATSTSQTRSSHHHHHHHHGHAQSSHHDNSYLTSTNKSDAGVQITRLGLFSNLGMAIIKAVGGYTFNSQALVADAWHSLTDMASDILTLATVSWSTKPPSSTFPTGYGKVESLGALGVSGMLVIGGGFMCLNSCEILYAHFLLDNVAEAAVYGHHGHIHGSHTGPSLHAAWLALGTIFVKEWLYHATMKIARQRNSSVLASNAIHHRIDSLTGIVTLFAILGANFLREATWLDPVGGLLISLLVIKGGWGNTVKAIYELADSGLDDEIKTSISLKFEEKFASDPVKSQVELRGIEGVKSGPNYLVDVQLAVPSTWTLRETSEVEGRVRDIIGSSVRGISRIKIRFVARDVDPSSLLDEYVTQDYSQDPEGLRPHTHSEPMERPLQHNTINTDEKKIL
ncbi:Bgt-2724 [Blumeria graminis f. sp. tritici]|uniref:Bgt-2724 n=3 Tax=Blumeria graminis TaxID=34373 RepID=A0A061HLU7_BLUGR|nr:metal transporter [Blumeria graminis f. sp. tritici 96224]VDB83940.1 Bgt-2724 [Blumeria graminis f. sp. tritici]